MATLDDHNALLLFRVGPVLCCAPSLPIDAIIAPPSLTHPPGSSTDHPGIFKYGRNIVSVIDLRHRYGVDKSDWEPGRLVIATLESQHIGFWVDEILDVIEMPTKGWGGLPPLIPKGIFSRTLLLQERIHLYSEFHKLAGLKQSGYLKHYIERLQQDNNTTSSPPEQTTAAEKNQPDGNNTTIPAATASRQNTERTHAARDKTDNPAKAKDAVTHEASRLHKTEPPDRQKTTAEVPHPLQHRTQLAETKTGRTGAAPPLRTAARMKTSDATASHAMKQKTKLSQRTTAADKSFQTTPAGTSTLSDARAKRRQTTSLNNISAGKNRHTAARRQPQNPAATTRPHPSRPAAAPVADGVTAAHQRPIPPAATESGQAAAAGGWWMPGFVFLLLLGGGGLGWYLLKEEPRKPVQITPPLATQATQPLSGITTAANPADVTSLSATGTPGMTTAHASDSLPDAPSHPSATATTATAEITPPAQTVQDTQPPALQKPSEKKKPQRNAESVPPSQNRTAAAAAPTPGTPGFHAEITKNETDITIILHAPDNTPAIRPSEEDSETPHGPASGTTMQESILPENTVQNTSTGVKETPPDNTATPDDSKEITVREKTTSKPHTRKKLEIIHIVVKGDTLWDIAGRYVQNPFRYPELARLSKIKNPDLIYPGNRVHIIQYQNRQEPDFP